MNVITTAILVVTLVVNLIMAVCVIYILYNGADEESVAILKKLVNFLSIIVQHLVEQSTAKL